MSLALKVENLSKIYQLGEIGTGTMTQDLSRWYARLRGKEDPFLKIGEINDRTTKGNSDVVWSLRDVNFEIEQGEAIGIIGKNGAGKSTLLKILSRITSPTIGRIRGNGRVASLLEVGTGFNQELTGRENIFLNGAILGMRKAEIKKHFDAIVDFAGVERYIDTPVKRYSSGMYVRLAFAVAAYLESEILIVDEVLAVGDIEFQKKCLGKMGDVSKSEGRTVLFVSHTMSSIKQLCTKTILLNNGSIELQGPTKNVINHYLSNNSSGLDDVILEPGNNSEIRFESISVVNENSDSGNFIGHADNFQINIVFEVIRPVFSAEISLNIRNSSGINVMFTSLSDAFSSNVFSFKTGKYRVKTKVRGDFLLPDTYTIDILVHHRNVRVIERIDNAIRFSIAETGSFMAPYTDATDICCVIERCGWELENITQ